MKSIGNWKWNVKILGEGRKQYQMLEKNYSKKIVSAMKTFSYEVLLDLLRKGIYTFQRFEIKVHIV